VALEHDDALGAALALGPGVEGLAAEPRGVPVGVDRGALVHRADQRVERSRRVAGRQPVGRDLRVARAAGLELGGQLAVQRAPAQPRHVLVDRVARQRVPEGRPSRLRLHDQAARLELVEPVRPAQRGDEPDVEARAHDGQRLRGRARRDGQVGGLQHHRVADRLRQRDVGVERELEPRLAGGQPAARGERGRELLDEEGDAPGAVVQRAREPRGGRGVEHPLGERGGAPLAQRADRQLTQLSRAAQVVAQAPERMGARDLVAAEGADHEDRQLVQPRREGGEELERRVVGPLEVVEQQQGRGIRPDRDQPAADGLEERRTVALRGRRTQLGEQERKVPDERAAAPEAAGGDPEESAQGGGDRPVGERAGAGGPAEEADAGGCGHLLHEAGLAHAGLAAQEHERPTAVARLGERRVEGGPLGLALDHGVA
jgi:hypothetical protein